MVDKEVIQIKTCELYDLLSVKCVDIMLAHKLLSQVYNVIRYRHAVQIAKTPEVESLARWSLGDAREALNSTLYAMNICSLDAVLVRWIADYSEYEEK
jgi:hypothetical protein